MQRDWIKAALALATLALGFADLVTTNEILRLGFGEANPVMRIVQEWLGVWWLIPKLGLTGVVALLLWRGDNLRHISFVVAFLSTPVLNNLIVIAGN